jgi:hypothetical protein
MNVEAHANIHAYLIVLEQALEHILSRHVSELVIDFSPNLVHGSFAMEPQDMGLISSKIVQWLYDCAAIGSTIHTLVIINDLFTDETGNTLPLMTPVEEDRTFDAIQSFLHGLTEWNFS